MFQHGLAALLAASACAAGARAAAPNVVRGVNTGGWLVTEPWMTPTLFEDTNTTCEWDLCNALGKKECLNQLQNHWEWFYTRSDFEQIKDAGLSLAVRIPSREMSCLIDNILTHCSQDSVRIPLGFWAVDIADYEPYVSGQYPYLIRAVQWCNELGLSVMVDLHGVPGSQNGWEESGIVGAVEFPTNSSNSDRSLKVLKNLTSEFSQDIYGGAVTNIEIMNEPIFDPDKLKEYYTAGSNVVGVANSSGINVTFHDGFYNPPYWKNYNPYDSSADSPAPHVTLDTHQFWAFPPLNDLSPSEILGRICAFGNELKHKNSGLLPVLVGEWSLSTGHTGNSTTDAGQDRAKRTWFRKLFEAQNAAFTPDGPGQASIGWYMWAWKTQYNIDAWSYQKGIAQGYIPSNVSDPSTYAFPTLKDGTGCIDQSFDYTAAAISSTSTATSTASSTADGNSHASTTTSGSGASATGESAAWSLCSGRMITAWLAVALMFFASMR